MDNLVADFSTSVTEPFKLAAIVQDGWRASEYIATMRKVINTLKTAIAEMSEKRTFGLGFDPERDRWYVILNADLDKTSNWNPKNAGNTSRGTGIDASWLLLSIHCN